MGLQKKFVIVGNVITLGNVVYHSELHGSPQGGGFWFLDKDENVLYLYGKSTQFGPVTKQQVDNAIITKPQFKYTKVIFEPNPNKLLSQVLIEHVGLGRTRQLMNAEKAII